VWLSAWRPRDSESCSSSEFSLSSARRCSSSAEGGGISSSGTSDGGVSSDGLIERNTWQSTKREKLSLVQ
jgi:hypothetical protein